MGREGAVDHEVKDLAQRAWAAWRDAYQEFPEVVVEPAIPILYFGDLEAYLGSPVRVVTVGLNPSREEFPVDDRFRRFPRVRDETARDTDSYIASLNEYFRTDPYRAWFSTFEHLLNGMDASYYEGRTTTALHTDICSPVATDPTWSGLTDTVKKHLIVSGRPLWHDLIRVLRPAVMLISVATSHLAKITFPMEGAVWDLHRLDGSRTRPYLVKAWRIRLDDESSCLVVFGQAAQRPFGTVGRADKHEIGRLVGQVVAGG